MKRPPKRDAKGQLMPGGGSLNPGGMPREVAELRREALRGASGILEALHEVALKSDNEVARVLAAKAYLARALGREASPLELPDDSPVPPPPEHTPGAGALLDRSLRLLERSLHRFETQMNQGQALSEAQVTQIAGYSQTLAALAREERELAKAGAGASLPDAKLLEELLAKVPLEQLQAALTKRGAP